MSFTFTNPQSAHLKIHEIFFNSAKILGGYVLYLIAGAYIFMLCERENEVLKKKIRNKNISLKIYLKMAIFKQMALVHGRIVCNK